MAYYLYINSANNTYSLFEPFQAYYSSISNLYPPTDDFVAPSLYSFSWAQREFLKPTQKSPTVINTATSKNSSNVQQAVSQRQSKKVAKNYEKQILSAKKNSESNIINQFFSFFGNRQKSERIVQRCCLIMQKSPAQLQEIFSLFYAAIKLIKAKRGRQYANIAKFLRFFNSEALESYLPEMGEMLASCGVLSMEQLSEMFRRCCKHFLRNIIHSAILTSKRTSLVSKEEHLKKRRKFLRAMAE